MHGISISQAVTIAKTHFLITGDVSVLDGDEDFNFKNHNGKYLLCVKNIISKPQKTRDPK